LIIGGPIYPAKTGNPERGDLHAIDYHLLCWYREFELGSNQVQLDVRVWDTRKEQDCQNQQRRREYGCQKPPPASQHAIA
jgi:hypothetical protein